MPDPAPSPAPATEAAPEPRARGYFNKTQLADIDLAETIAAAAADPDHAAGLAEEDIDAPFVTRFQENLARAREKTAATGQGGDRKKQSTRAATTAQEKLVEALQGIQSAAKQRARVEAHDEDPTTNFAAAGYLIGQRLDPNRETLLQSAATLIGKAKAEPLPGHKPPKVAAIEALLTTYRDSETAQSSTSELSGEELIARDKLVALINNHRTAIQHAADRLYPHAEPENRPARRTFHLPQNRTLGG